MGQKVQKTNMIMMLEMEMELKIDMIMIWEMELEQKIDMI
jgi:hypothetical protein